MSDAVVTATTTQRRRSPTKSADTASGRLGPSASRSPVHGTASVLDHAPERKFGAERATTDARRVDDHSESLRRLEENTESLRRSEERVDAAKRLEEQLDTSRRLEEQIEALKKRTTAAEAERDAALERAKRFEVAPRPCAAPPETSVRVTGGG
jgi:hypothetical protein